MFIVTLYSFFPMITAFVLYSLWSVTKLIHYPTGDTYSLLRAAANMEGFLRVKNQYVVHWREDMPDPGGSHFGQVQNNSYVLSLALLKYIPEYTRLRAAQVSNIMFFLIFLSMMHYNLYQLLMHTSSQPRFAHISALLFTLLVASRVRILLLVSFGFTDVLNYMLLMIELIFLQSYTQNTSPATIVVLGIFVGLACRNRVQDMLRFCAYVLFFFISGTPIMHQLLFAGVVTGCHLDIIIINDMRHKQNPFLYFLAIFHQTRGQQAVNSNISTLIRDFVVGLFVGLKVMVNFYSNQSLWPVLGGLALLTPLSLLILAQHNIYPKIILLLSIYAILLCGSCFFFKHHIFTKDHDPQSLYYFSGRQMTILFPVLAVVNCLAFSLLWQNGQVFLLLPYLLYIVFHFIHQVFRLIGYAYNGVIEETKYDPFPCQPPSWQTALGQFIRDRKQGTVLLGSYLNFGEVFNFFGWNAEKRFVDVYCRLTVTRLLEFIRRYEITHIALTPASCFNSGFIDQNGNITSSLLRPLLQRLPQTTPNLHLFAVNFTGQHCPAKEHHS